MKNNLHVLVCAALLAIAGTGCDTAPTASDETPDTADALLTAAHRGTPALQHQLAAVRAATTPYHDVRRALEDGYVDIDVVIPNMGRHFLNPALLDDTFELRKPELLVYAERPNGMLRLVAAEYATPRDPTNPPPPPEGFVGSADAWSANLDFDLWTLHVWVWHHNPDGIFAAMNPRVP